MKIRSNNKSLLKTTKKITLDHGQYAYFPFIKLLTYSPCIFIKKLLRFHSLIFSLIKSRKNSVIMSTFSDCQGMNKKSLQNYKHKFT